VHVSRRELSIVPDRGAAQPCAKETLLALRRAALPCNFIVPANVTCADSADVLLLDTERPPGPFDDDRGLQDG